MNGATGQRARVRGPCCVRTGRPVADRVRDDQFLDMGRDFPIGENSSRWTTLELRD